MNDNQNAKLNMGQRVLETLTAHQNVFSGIAPMVKTVAELKTNIAAIREAAKEQTAVNISALTLEKRAAEEKMISAAIKMANALYVIGFTDDKKELANLSGISAYSFYRVEDNVKLTLAKNLYDYAKQNAKALAEYGFDEQKIEQAGAAIDAYSDLIAKPMHAIATRKQKTTNLKELFAEMDSILYDKLDKMLVLFKDSDPNFYGEYRTSRNFINLSVIHKKPQ